MAVMTYREALNLALREEMRRDPRVFVMGEEVGLYEGAYKVTQGLLKEFGPARVVDTPIAESGFTGLLIASSIGVILPGGPFTIYPIAGAFLAIGADAGAAIAFVTSWTLLGVNRAVIWELPFFGLDFVTWRVLIAIPLPMLAGLMARFVVRTLNWRPEAK